MKRHEEPGRSYVAGRSVWATEAGPPGDTLDKADIEPQSRLRTQVPNDAAAVSIGMRLPQLLRGGAGESVQKKKLPDRRIPNGVYDGFVSENRVTA